MTKAHAALHTEEAFETVVESVLLANGYSALTPNEFDRSTAIFPEPVINFIRATQPREWKALEALHGDNTSAQVLADLVKWIDANGSLATLRHGFKCYGKNSPRSHIQGSTRSERRAGGTIRRQHRQRHAPASLLAQER